MIGHLERPRPAPASRQASTGSGTTRADAAGAERPGPLTRVLQAGVVVYGVVLLGFVWLTKDLSLASLRRDPLFAGYSIAVVMYVLSRFVFSVFYRPFPDRGHRPTVSIVIPAFNEEDGIEGTIESCLAVDYPENLVEVVVVNDGSTDATWERILRAKARHTRLRAVDLVRNYGKRGAMAEGVRRSSGAVVCFVDSDSYLEPDALHQIVQPFADDRVGAVVGHADVANAMTNWLTKMQQVRYYSAFRVIKGTESLLGGNVICASGCCSAYRRSSILPVLDEWEFQTFLGRPATFGDDRALTNRVLQRQRVVYQETARSHTVAPDRLRVFFRQQLRWKKSWLRESLTVCRYIWRKHPIAAVLTYASIAFPFIAPLVVTRAVVVRVLSGTTGDGMWFYLIGTYTMALLYCLYYALKRHNGLWHHGLTFVGVYMSVLVFQTYWAIVTMRDNRWGTRASTVHQERIDPATVVDLPGRPLAGWAVRSLGARPPAASCAPSRRPWQSHGGRLRRQAFIGLVALPLSVVPFGFYFARTAEGALLWAKASTTIAAPRVPVLDEADRAWARANAPSYEGAVALLVYHGVGRGTGADGARFTISPARFAQQLATLRAAGMNAVTARDVALHALGHRRLPPNAYMVSFDDGRADAMLWADPILERLGLRATMFVITGAASERGLYYVPWSKLRSYTRTGRWDIQSHTAHGHVEHAAAGGRRLPWLASFRPRETEAAFDRRVRADLREASRTIRREIGTPPVAFAYPFGAYAGEGDARTNHPRAGDILGRAVQDSYVVAFNQDEQAAWRPAGCGDDPRRYRRLEVGDWTGRALLRRIAGARPPACEPAAESGGPPAALATEPPAAPAAPAPRPPSPARPTEALLPPIDRPSIPQVPIAPPDAPPVVAPRPPVATPPPAATPAPAPGEPDCPGRGSCGAKPGKPGKGKR